MQFIRDNQLELGVIKPCECCGARADDGGYHNIGINIFPSHVPITEENSDFWVESVRIGDEWLCIKHRKVLDKDNQPYDEEEDEDDN